MSKLGFILILISLIWLNSLIAQPDSNNVVELSDTLLIKRNSFTIDIDLFSASFSYKKQIAKKWKVGFNAGIGPAIKPVLNSYFIGDYELYSVGIPFQYQLFRLIHIDIEPRYAYLTDSYWNKEHTFGIGTGFFIGGKIIQYGFKTMFGRTTQSDPDYFISNTYLVLRFSVIKW